MSGRYGVREMGKDDSFYDGKYFLNYCFLKCNGLWW